MLIKDVLAELNIKLKTFPMIPSAKVCTIFGEEDEIDAAIEKLNNCDKIESVEKIDMIKNPMLKLLAKKDARIKAAAVIKLK